MSSEHWYQENILSLADSERASIWKIVILYIYICLSCKAIVLLHDTVKI